MTKPRITASMLRKRPKPEEPAETQPSEPEPEAAAEAAFDLHADHAGSMADNPSFRAPQFGIKPRIGTQTNVRVQHAPRRRFESGRAS
jgi:hypothetical protein